MTFTFDKNKLQENIKLGSGKVSTVYPYYKEQNENWVVKKIQVKSPLQFQQQNNGVVSSISHDHPAILPIRGYFIQELGPETWTMYVKLPKMDNNLQTLKEELIKKKTAVSKEQMIRYLYRIASALEYLERKKIVHQNLKPTNLLLDKDGRIYLTDIGINQLEGVDPKDVSETELYVAPETLVKGVQLKKRDLIKADTWSLAAVLAELGVSKPKPITPSLSNDAKGKLIKEIIADLKKNYGNTVPDLLTSMLSIDPTQRKSYGEIVKALEAQYPKELADEKPKVDEATQKSASSGMMGLMNTGVYLYKKAEDLIGTSTKKGAIERFEEKKEVKVAKAAGSYLASAAGWWGSKKKEEPAKIEEAATKESAESETNASAFILNEVVQFQPIDSAKITDANIQELFTNTIIPLKSDASKPLLKLAVSLKECSQVSDEGLKQFGKLLADNLYNLQYLSLSIQGCEKVTDEGAKELVSQIAQNLKALQQLDLSFQDSAKVTNQGKESMKKELLFIPRVNF